MITLRIGFVDTFDGVSDFFSDILSENYKIVRDDLNPQILFFGDENFGNRNVGYSRDNTVKIFYTGENRNFRNYSCDYALTFEHLDNERHFRMPLYYLNMHYLEKRFGVATKTTPHYMDFRNLNFPVEQRNFCGYVQTNPNCQKRTEFFHKLSKYKPVRAAGPHLNNVGYVLPRGQTGIIDKLVWLSGHKFTMAFENGTSPGYVTEKLLEAWLAGTVPIYWGSPTVELDFNKNGYVNWHDFKNDEDCIEFIKYLDTTPSLYENWIKAGLFNRFGAYNNFESFFEPTKIQFLRWFDTNVISKNKLKLGI